MHDLRTLTVLPAAGRVGGAGVQTANPANLGLHPDGGEAPCSRPRMGTAPGRTPFAWGSQSFRAGAPAFARCRSEAKYAAPAGEVGGEAAPVSSACRSASRSAAGRVIDGAGSRRFVIGPKQCGQIASAVQDADHGHRVGRRLEEDDVVPVRAERIPSPSSAACGSRAG